MLKVQIIDTPNAGVNPHCALVANLVEEIAQKSHRIVEFEAMGLSELTADALVHPANNLRRLRINGHNFEDLPLIFGGLIPRLERLTLSNPSGWSLRLFPEITKVTLFFGGNGVSMKSLVDFLDGARKLEVLSLSRYRDPGSPPDRTRVRKLIPLPHLRELNLSFCEELEILGCLVLPPSAHVSILAGPDPENKNIFSCIPDAPGFRRFLSNTQSLTVALHPANNEFYLSMHGHDKPSCFLRVYDDKKRLDGRWVLRSVNAAPRFKPFLNIESLTVSVENYTVPWKSWLPQLDRLVRIEVASVDLSELILALSVMRAARKRPICPSLRYLSVEPKEPGRPIDYSRLRSCLLSRARAGHPVSRLRIRSEDWARIVQVDPGWKELAISRGNVYVIFGVSQRSPDALGTTDGLTTLFMKGNPTSS